MPKSYIVEGKTYTVPDDATLEDVAKFITTSGSGVPPARPLENMGTRPTGGYTINDSPAAQKLDETLKGIRNPSPGQKLAQDLLPLAAAGGGAIEARSGANFDAPEGKSLGGMVPAAVRMATPYVKSAAQGVQNFAENHPVIAAAGGAALGHLTGLPGAEVAGAMMGDTPALMRRMGIRLPNQQGPTIAEAPPSRAFPTVSSPGPKPSSAPSNPLGSGAYAPKSNAPTQPFPTAASSSSGQAPTNAGPSRLVLTPDEAATQQQATRASMTAAKPAAQVQGMRNAGKGATLYSRPEAAAMLKMPISESRWAELLQKFGGTGDGLPLDALAHLTPEQLGSAASGQLRSGSNLPGSMMPSELADYMAERIK